MKFLDLISVLLCGFLKTPTLPKLYSDEFCAFKGDFFYLIEETTSRFYHAYLYKTVFNLKGTLNIHNFRIIYFHI